MDRLKETILTIWLATKYSLSFCWKNSRRETLARIIISVLNTGVLYMGINAAGLIFNAAQKAAQQFPGKVTLIEILRTGLLTKPFAIFAGVMVFGIIFSRFSWFYRNRWNHILRFANQRELNDHRATLDVARFRSKEYDDLSRRIQELPSSWQTRIYFSEEIFGLFTTIVSFVLFGMSLIWYKPIYVIILIVTALPMAITEFRLVSMWWTLFQDLVPHHKKRSVLERPYHSLNAFTQALTFNQMPELRKEIDINLNFIISTYDSIRKRSLMRQLATHEFAIFGLLAVCAHAVWMMISTHSGFGTLTIVFAAARTFQSNLESIVSLIAEQWNSAKGVILIQNDFLGMKPLIRTPYPVVPKFNLVPPLRFDHVSFSYPDTNKEVLRDMSFTIEPGSKVAIVGKSGNGKSTIQALLMRHYDPTSGTVYAGDISLRNIEPNVWCNIASALAQEYAVLDRRVGEEIASSRLGQPMDIANVAASAQFARFDEVIESDPNGYDSQIGTEFGGRDFSGGERQRLALARVHYRGTPILILDEPDAKLDPESAEAVIDNVFALQGITVVIITHHVSRAERCDKILVVGKGQIVEEGTHQELMALGGSYASMHKMDRERLGSVSDD